MDINSLTPELRETLGKVQRAGMQLATDGLAQACLAARAQGVPPSAVLANMLLLAYGTSRRAGLTHEEIVSGFVKLDEKLEQMPPSPLAGMMSTKADA